LAGKNYDRTVLIGVSKVSQRSVGVPRVRDLPDDIEGGGEGESHQILSTLVCIFTLGSVDVLSGIANEQSTIGVNHGLACSEALVKCNNPEEGCQTILRRPVMVVSEECIGVNSTYSWYRLLFYLFHYR
jgi:hypothetical protein